MLRPQSGVALIITLIMISVITFMAITFLAVSQREKGAVTNTTEQITAKLAADAAQERAQAELLASILANTNVFNFDLLVSTNFINPNGYLSGINDPTNVNYEAAAVLNSQPEQQRNLANLWYSPRAPVFITNKSSGRMEFRYYVDLNRDGFHTPSGWLIVTNETGGFYDTNGSPMPVSGTPPPNTLSNYFIGDPEFIGLLRRADRTHSPTNDFLARYAYIVVPAGRTLDVNFIHNHAKEPTSPVQDGFYRNQGVGSWEINLAAFFADLNTNIWGGAQYAYNTNVGFQSLGLAFQDALSFTRFRYGYNVQQLYSVQRLYGGPGDLAFRTDGIDGYSAGPLLTGLYQPLNDPDVSSGLRTSRPWSGANNTNHFFTTQDLFDPTKTGVGAGGGNTFVDRMKLAQRFSPSSYDRYTYYRLLAQLGTDSAPESDTKLNVNYVNVGGLRATNYVAWNDPDLAGGDPARGIPAFGRRGSELFFRNAADRMLKRHSRDSYDLDATNGLANYTNRFGSANTFGVENIPVFVNGRFVYTPAVHRLLQVAANLYDAINPTYFPGSTNARPAIFRPIFKTAGPGGADVYISDFVEVTNAASLAGLPFRELTSLNAATLVQPDELIYGVPLVVAARAGLPNFNEFAAESIVQITRKLELVKSAPGAGNMITQTNQMFVIGVSNVFGAEFWNSYATNYARAVDIFVTNYCSLSVTNDACYVTNQNYLMGARMAVNAWPKWSSRQSDASLVVPLQTNLVVIPDLVYREGTKTFIGLTERFVRQAGFPFPDWGLTITNRVVAMIRDRATGWPIDHVQFSQSYHRAFAREIATNDNVVGFDGLWATNVVSSGPCQYNLSDQKGVIQQILISRGDVESGQNWQNNGLGQAAGATKAQAIANFLAFFTANHVATYADPETGMVYIGTNSSLVATVPFSPTAKRSVRHLWQANDPLVHYTTGDMYDLERSGEVVKWNPPALNKVTVPNLKKVNERYQPWGGNPFVTSAGSDTLADPLAHQPAIKDPGMTRSDDWRFPVNKLPTLGWLGRIHRGTPWQTIYLKSSRVADVLEPAGPLKPKGPQSWQYWTGNPNRNDAAMTQPETDRDLLDLFTTALNDNATRGQLPINQTNLAAWSAVFSGLVALSNTVPDAKMYDYPPPLPTFDPWIIDPAGYYDPANPAAWPAVLRLVDGINRARNATTHRTFSRLGEILATRELTDASPFLNTSDAQKTRGLNDAAYEWLPQQMLSLVRVGEPRFVIYSFGQTLKAAPRGTLVAGPYQGMITNYQITAEVATRAVVRVEGSPDPQYTNDTQYPYPDPRGKWRLDPRGGFHPPRIVVENFNVLPPD